MGYSSVAIFGVLLLQATLSSADDCTTHTGVTAVSCPGGGVPKQGDGSRGSDHSGRPILVDPCKAYVYDGPPSQSYLANTDLPFQIIVTDTLITGSNQVSIRRFHCSISGGSEECVVYILDSGVTTPVKFRQDQQKKFTFQGKGKVTFQISGPGCPSCDSGWAQSSTKCYQIGPNTMEYDAGNTYCGNQHSGATLAILDSQAEVNFIYNTFNRDTNIWIGLRDAAQSPNGANRNFQWEDGTTYGFTSWKWPDPNNARGDEWCVFGKARSNSWIDAPCFWAYIPLCSYAL